MTGERANPDPVVILIARTGEPAASFAIEPTVVQAARDLPYAPERYFSTSAHVLNIALQQLLLSRLRPEGVASAVRLMAAAYAGRQSRREPVAVRPLAEGKYLVLDGNSTTAVAHAAGWPDIACHVVQKSPEDK